MKNCKFCDKLVKVVNHGYCVSCYQYFITKQFKVWHKSEYGEISTVQDKNSKQYEMPVCHVCGKAFTKLQQHVYYSHNMTKMQYCDKFGLDHKIQLTSKQYHEKMSKSAYANNMDEQLKIVGKNTRFSDDRHSYYKRSYMTKERLKNNFKEYQNGTKNSN